MATPTILRTAAGARSANVSKAAGSNASRGHLVSSHLGGVAWRWKGTTAAATLAASIWGYQEFQELKQLRQLEEQRQQRQRQQQQSGGSNTAAKSPSAALTIDFDRIELVQSTNSQSNNNSQQRRFFQRFGRRALFSRNSEDDDADDADDWFRISAPELAQLIHTAAQDDSIGALFGSFGSGLSGSPTLLGGGERNWADVEEIRNALKVFGQSHRRHYEPSKASKANKEQQEEEAQQEEEGERSSSPPMVPHVSRKPMVAYAQNLGAYRNPANPPYYLASAFDSIYLSPSADVQWLGVASTSFFLKGLLERYGIFLHVFKHGPYKTAPNTFTEHTWTTAHKESVSNLVAELNASICLDVTQARWKPLVASGAFSPLPNPRGSHRQNKKKATSSSSTLILSDAQILSFWQVLHDSGTMTAQAAQQAGLVDVLCPRNPLKDWLEYNKNKQKNNKSNNKDEAVAGNALLPPPASFVATKAITVRDYQEHVQRVQKAKAKRTAWATWWTKWLGQGSMPSLLQSPSSSFKKDTTVSSRPKDRIACLDVIGSIDDDKARSIVQKIQALKKMKLEYEKSQESKKQDDQDDEGKHKSSGGMLWNRHKSKAPVPPPPPKALVMRVVSPGGQIFACEQISQELQALDDIPVIVSFGNVAASGGYYIAAHADRIFASTKTLTGSIGVFGIRADLTGLCQQYGVGVEHVASARLATLYSPVSKLSTAAQRDMEQSVDRWYQLFLNVVQQGRRLNTTNSNQQVQDVAQGRVWTGRQAKEVGLVDEIGGYQRALAYAKRTYCNKDSVGDDDEDDDNVEVFHVKADRGPFWKRAFGASSSRGRRLTDLTNDGDDDENEKNNNNNTISAAAMAWQDVQHFLWDTVATCGGVEPQQQEHDMEWNGSSNSSSIGPSVAEWLLTAPTAATTAAIPGTMSAILMTMDENSAIDALLQDLKKQQQQQRRQQ